jgi:hypothetical protein
LPSEDSVIGVFLLDEGEVAGGEARGIIKDVVHRIMTDAALGEAAITVLGEGGKAEDLWVIVAG